MTAAERIGKLLEIYELNAKVFSEKIGLDRPQAVYDILTGKTRAITEKMAIKIISAFPEVNKVWLLTGEGQEVHTMVLAKEQEQADDESLKQQLDDALMLIAKQALELERLRERLSLLEEKGDAVKNVG